ncbi:uncharacterized protein LOC134265713 [Saccostrea cucullata]|uniref:uncharacterized protein LOC134265713 n=1 Tax=Saccostrea cuccullata TaxID=36930 RepID=UPI002ED26945
MSRFRKFVLEWNRVILASALTAGSLAELFGFCAPETLFLKEYKYLLTLKEMEEPYPLTPKLEEAKNEVFQDLIRKGRLSQQQLEKMDIILNGDMNDPFHKGNLNSRFGTFIALPITFTYNHPEEVPMDNFMIGQTLPIEDGTQEGAVLKKSIIQGKNAVKYALLRECLLTDSYDMQIKYLLLAVFLAICSALVYLSVTRIKSRSQLLLTLLPSIPINGLVLLQFWCWYKRRKDSNVDLEVAEFGPDYINGGLEYYTQIVRRNKALYYIMKDNTRDHFTAAGNEKEYFFWNDRIPVKTKRDFFMQRVEEMNEAVKKN